jgi:hypothetical protein
MEIGSVNPLKFVKFNVFIFKLCHLKAFDDYITLHNLKLKGEPLPYKMELLLPY